MTLECVEDMQGWGSVESSSLSVDEEGRMVEGGGRRVVPSYLSGACVIVVYIYFCAGGMR